MLNFRRILFPIDFSESSKQTAPYVAWIARKFHSQVTLLHALDIFLAGSSAPLFRPDLQSSYEDLIRKQRESDLIGFAPAAFVGLKATRIVENGDAAETIVRHTEKNEIDLIVMPTHGWGTFRWLLLGSVTAKVLHDVSCPVWTMVHSETFVTSDTNKIRTIVCGVDPYSEPIRVIQAASEIAGNCGAAVHLVHAIPAPEARPGSTFDLGFKSYLFDTAGERMAKCQHDAHADWEVCIQGGTISSVIRDAAIRLHADLVIIGRGHLPNHFGRLRTNVGAIIRESPCPVLSV